MTPIQILRQAALTQWFLSLTKEEQIKYLERKK